MDDNDTLSTLATPAAQSYKVIIRADFGEGEAVLPCGGNILVAERLSLALAQKTPDIYTWTGVMCPDGFERSVLGFIVLPQEATLETWS